MNRAEYETNLRSAYAVIAGLENLREDLNRIVLDLADEWDRRADTANAEIAAGAIHGCASELREAIGLAVYGGDYRWHPDNVDGR